MKKYLAIFTTIILGLCIFISFSAHAQIQNNMSTRDFKSGKWVPEYGGASKPFRCFCAESSLSSQCRVGDITSNVSLCE